MRLRKPKCGVGGSNLGVRGHLEGCLGRHLRTAESVGDAESGGPGYAPFANESYRQTGNAGRIYPLRDIGFEVGDDLFERLSRAQRRLTRRLLLSRSRMSAQDHQSKKKASNCCVAYRHTPSPIPNQPGTLRIGDPFMGPRVGLIDLHDAQKREIGAATLLTVPLHDNEFPIDTDLVEELLTRQMPQWKGLPLQQFRTAGTVNMTFRLGDDKLVRLPRTRDFSAGPEREYLCLPAFAGKVPLEVPAFLALGVPTDSYPSHWSVLSWIAGTNGDQSTLRDLESAATALGEFVVALRRVSTDGAPQGGNYRAFGLSRVDQGLRRWASKLPDDIDQTAVLRVWEQCLAIGDWDGPPTWLHSDLRGDNLIADHGSLVGVIDWEGCTVGDPSADYLSAWWLFDSDTRHTFRTAANATHSGWMRAKGWALHMAVAAIPYYTETNPAFVAQARKALAEIIADE